MNIIMTTKVGFGKLNKKFENGLKGS